MKTSQYSVVESRASITPMHAEPRVSSSQVSQMLRNHQALVLQHEGDWLRIQTADMYTGWCHAGYVRPIESASMTVSGWSDRRRMSMGCAIEDAEGRRVVLPVGALLDDDDRVVDGIALSPDEREALFAPTDLLQWAPKLFVGTPYQWGGITPWGADCSGFVQSVFAISGLLLPRDAWQQAGVGEQIDGDWAQAQPGDLLFFAEGRVTSPDDTKITHVAIAMGDSKIMHCALSNGGFGVDQLNAELPLPQRLRTSFVQVNRLAAFLK